MRYDPLKLFPPSPPAIEDGRTIADTHRQSFSDDYVTGFYWGMNYVAVNGILMAQRPSNSVGYQTGLAIRLKNYPDYPIEVMGWK